MSDLAYLKIWDDPAIRDSLSWYLDVAENQRPAKFRIAATVGTQIDPAACSEEALWAELDRLTPIFLGRWQAIRPGAPLPATADGPSLLEVCRELAYRMLAHCNFCPWNCRVDRMAGAKFGACKLASASRVSSHFHHTGEELFFRGTEGSGTIFFTSCNMRCAFCQNGDISTDKDNGSHGARKKYGLVPRQLLVSRSQLDALEARGYLNPTLRGVPADEVEAVQELLADVIGPPTKAPSSGRPFVDVSALMTETLLQPDVTPLQPETVSRRRVE